MGLRNRFKFHDKQIFFITTTCYKWLHLLSIHENMKLVADNLNHYCKKYNASMIAYVIMPNHIHMIINFVEGKNRVPFMRDFKKYTSTMIRRAIAMHQPTILHKLYYELGKQKFKVWQDRFDELYLESRELLEKKMDYIHQNPLQVHWSLVEFPEDYVYSSASFYIVENKNNPIQLVHYTDFV